MEKLIKDKRQKIIDFAFEERVKSGWDIVRKLYPEAKLYKVDFNKVKDKFLFSLKFSYTDEKTILINETSFNKWNKPLIYNEMFFGVDYFDWPAKMTFEKAFELRLKANFGNEFSEVLLMKHFFETPSNPCYFFNGNPSVSVDTVTGEVYPTYRIKR